MKSNVLLILGSMFALSLLGRSFALAGSDGAEMAMTQTMMPEKPGEMAAEMASMENEHVCVTGPILESFKKRRLQIEEKETKIANRARTLEVLEKRIAERMAALDESNTLLEGKMTLLRNMAEDDVVHLTQMYENMKPKQASEIFNKMDTVFAAGFLRLIDSNHAGLILANMNTDKAYAISIVIANTNALFRVDNKSG